MKKKINKLLRNLEKGFTLVELIIVIAIITILAVWALMLLTKWIGESRDSKRLADLETLRKGLTVYYTNVSQWNWKYPACDSINWTCVQIVSGYVSYWEQGYVTQTISKASQLNKTVKDPSWDLYTYRVTNNRQKFQLMAYLENWQEYQIVATNQVQAENLDYASMVPYVVWYKLWMFIDKTTNKLAQMITTWSIDITSWSIQTVYKAVVSVEWNRIKIISWAELANLEDYTEVSNTQSQNTNSNTDTSWCNYTYANWTYNTGWSIATDLGLHNNKCYIFWDEDTTAITACNKWVSDNLSGKIANWEERIWVPARWFVTDGNGTSLKDSFYQREVIYNQHTYVCRWFAVAKYEMSYDDWICANCNYSRSWETDSYNSSKTAVSKAWNYAITDINQWQAINACDAIWGHLITNNEWMAIVRNIEMQDANWSSWSVGSWYIRNWRSENTTLWCDWNADGSRAEPTGTACSEKQADVTTSRNVLTLSNWQKIWDFVGNVWEHVDRGNNPNTTVANVGVWNLCNSSGYWNNNWDPSTTCANDYWPIHNWTNWYTINIGMWYVRNNSWNDKVFLRGGGADNGGVRAGVYALILGRTTLNAYRYVGFRCVISK